MSNSIDWKFLTESQKFQMKGLAVETLLPFIRRLPIMEYKSEIELYQYAVMLHEYLNPRR